MNKIFECNIFSNIGFVVRKILHMLLSLSVAVIIFGFKENWLFPVAAVTLILVLIGEVIRLKTWMKLLKLVLILLSL